MPREGLPLKTVKEPERLGGGSSSEVFGFTPEEGKEYVYKEMKFGPRIFDWYHGETLEEATALMRTAYGVLKRYLGDYLVPTHFLIAKDESGESCIMKIQEKVGGRTVWDLLESGGWRLPSRIKRQTKEISEGVSEAEKDPELVGLAREGKLGFGGSMEEFFGEAGLPSNQIVDKSGHVRVVDW